MSLHTTKPLTPHQIPHISLCVCVLVFHAGVLPHQQHSVSSWSGAAGSPPSHSGTDQLSAAPKRPVRHSRPAGSGPQLPQGAQRKGRQVSIQQREKEVVPEYFSLAPI